MKPTAILAICLVLGILSSSKVAAQDNTTTYRCHGYFDSINLADSMMMAGDFEITIAQKEIQIRRLCLEDSTKDEVFLKRRTMSGMKYQTLEGQEYHVWRLGDRKMVLRELNEKRYLSIYSSDVFGLPTEYITFLIKD